MSLEERCSWGRVLIAKIAAITGWVIPDGNMQDVLVDQFEKKMIESFPNVNPDEFEYAFRSEGTTVKDWGKSINLSLIDEVMIPYLSKRMVISIKEEQLKTKELPTVVDKEDISDRAMVEWWKSSYKDVKDGKLKVDFIAPSLYDWKDRIGGINLTTKEKRQYLEKSVNYRQSRLVSINDTEGTQESRNELGKFLEMKNAGCFEGDEIKRLKDMAKRFIVFEMMQNDK